MNKVILMGRLTRDPEVRYSQAAEPTAIANFSLAVNKRFKRDGEPDADFINCVAFGRTADFIQKYFKKGQQVSVIGRLQTRSYDDQQGQKRYVTEVVVEEQYFADSKRDSYDSVPNAPSEYKAPTYASNNAPADFSSISEETDDDLPF